MTNGTFPNTPQWFAMSATYARELKAKEFFEKEKIECFVPMRYEISKDSKHNAIRRLVPAINNLIFVHTTRSQIQALKSQIPYLHYLIKTIDAKNIPITIPEVQMQHFISVCNTYNEKLRYLSPDEVNLKKGTRVRIAGGAFDGVEGVFVKLVAGRKKQVVVMIEGIIGVMLTHISDGYIQVIE